MVFSVAIPSTRQNPACSSWTVNADTLGTLLLALELLTAAAELDDLLLDVKGVLDLIELATLLGVDDAGAEDVFAPHRVPFTLGTPAVPVAWKPKLAEALGASVPFQPIEVAV